MVAEGHSGGFGLQRLSAPDLAAVGADSGVIRHILRLEGGDGKAAPEKGAAQSGNEKGLAHIRSSALDHQRSNHFSSYPRRRVSRSRVAADAALMLDPRLRGDDAEERR